MFKPLLRVLKWLVSRVGIIYVLLTVFILFCVDLKTVDERNKARQLNGMRPDFKEMIVFSKSLNHLENINWKPYKDYFEKVLKYMPDYSVANELMGYVYFNMGQEQKAIASYNKVLTISKNYFWPNYNLGVIYYKKGFYQEAFTCLRRAVESNPEWTIKYVYDSMMYRQIFVSGAFKYNLKEELNSAYSSAYILMLSSLERLKRYDAMLYLSLFVISKKEFPNQDAFFFYAALATFEMKQLDKSLSFFEQSLILDKNNPMTYLYLSRIYKMAGKDQASENLSRIFESLSVKKSERFPYDQNIGVRFF